GALPLSAKHAKPHRPARKGAEVSAFIITRIQVGDYNRWRPMFDQDGPRAREKAKVQRVFRGVEDPNHVFIVLEFDSVDHAQEARRRLVSSGLLDRFEDKHGPNVVVEADQPSPSTSVGDAPSDV